MRESLQDPSPHTLSQTLSQPLSEAPNPCSDSSALEAEVRELFQTAALMLGDEGRALELVEQSVAAVDMDPCADGAAARASYGQELVQRTLGHLASLYPVQMQPAVAADLGGCVETDDLGSAGISRDQLEEMISGSGRQRMRGWLESLAPVERVIFVLRAVLGRTSADTAKLLSIATHSSWNESYVGGAYRSALCSLASALLNSAVH